MLAQLSTFKVATRVVTSKASVKASGNVHRNYTSAHDYTELVVVRTGRNMYTTSSSECPTNQELAVAGLSINGGNTKILTTCTGTTDDSVPLFFMLPGLSLKWWNEMEGTSTWADCLVATFGAEDSAT